MPRPGSQAPASQVTLYGDAAAVNYFKQAINNGRHWYLALLETIGRWEAASETIDGYTYCYLIAGEAFDWLLLAERLCRTADGLLPDDEKTNLLFRGQPPLNLPKEQFRTLIGDVKYYQYLNYFYGITVEEAIVQAIQDEVRKEQWGFGHSQDKDTTNEVYRRIYGSTKAILLRHFRRDKSYPQRKSISLTELKEFTYWLFKYRLKHCEKTKMASDTKRALCWLDSNSLARSIDRRECHPDIY